MSAPKRIQRQRTKGWRMPEGAIYVGRPTRWGNPFRIERVAHPDGARWYVDDGLAVEFFNVKRLAARYTVECFAADLVVDVGMPPFERNTIREHLAGYDLACWCPLDQPCHADVLLKIANPTTTTTPVSSRGSEKERDA